jgi:hypothetical protein
MTHNERLTLRRVWPDSDWPIELEVEHKKRSEVYRRMGYGLALSTHQLFDLIVMFVGDDGTPMRRSQLEHVFTPSFDAETPVEQPVYKTPVGSKLLQEEAAVA